MEVAQWRMDKKSRITKIKRHTAETNETYEKCFADTRI